MAKFEVVAHETFLMQTTYRVEADTPEAAEALVRDGKVAYLHSSPLDDPGTLICIQHSEKLSDGHDYKMSDKVTPLRPR